MSAQISIFARPVPARNGQSVAGMEDRIDRARREYLRALREEKAIAVAPHLFATTRCWRRALLAASERTDLAHLGLIEALRDREAADAD